VKSFGSRTKGVRGEKTDCRFLHSTSTQVSPNSN
jgi:hypothetical protein